MNNQLFICGAITNFISSPLDQFEVVSILGFRAPILGYVNLTLTNLGLYCFIVLFLIISLHYFSNNEKRLIPNKWSIGLECSFVSIHQMVREQIGSSYEMYLPFIYSIFFFVIISNLAGNVPYNYTITTSVITSIGFSFTIFVGVTILGIVVKKWKFFASFIPEGTPLGLVPTLVCIEFISYIARAFSLGIRLFANMVAGHTLLKILSTFLFKMFTSSIILSVVTLLPFAIFAALIGLELGVSIIQAYVLTILTCSYIKDAIELH